MRLHHIRSTAISNILAKPIIDILIEADDPSAIDAGNGAMAVAGYRAMGEFGTPAGAISANRMRPAGARTMFMCLKADLRARSGILRFAII